MGFLKSTTPLSSEYDRQNIIAVKKRFLEINRKRLQRMREALATKQQLFLDLLPILFHSNHPMLPGYVSRNTPAILSNYKPSKLDVNLARTVARSFTLSYEPEKDDEIYGIYVMGSVGTIAQSNSSDLDIWLCFKPGISQRALRELQKKCDLISEWAASFRLEAHFFLMDTEAFKFGKISSLNEESSGSAQKLLLLDEFYRTAIFIGGRMPLWWFVPGQEELDYAHYSDVLLRKKFIAENHVIDFGGIAGIPDGEFLGAGIWQLYKAIESPYKSVLKLLLLEAYVHDYPNIEPLSLTFKNLIYEGELDIDALDSYVMIYHRIEKYLLNKKQFDRLELARRCFYFKVNKPLSKHSMQRDISWQRALLEKLTVNWRWTQKLITTMDRRAKWKAIQVNSERSLLVNELNLSYKFLLKFANSSKGIREISAEELTVLGRKLQAAFERRPGKIEWVNPNISEDLSEDVLAFQKIKDSASNKVVWTAVAKDSESANQTSGLAIKSAVDLIELILWSYFNGIIVEKTRLEISTSIYVRQVELRRIINALRSWLPLPLASLSHNKFQQSAQPLEVLMLLNVDKSPTPELDINGYQRLSDKTDALRYGGFEENLIVAIDMVIKNSWNEIDHRRFDGENALLDLLQDFLQLCIPGTHQHPPKLTIKCIGSSHATTIVQRAESWLREVTQCYYQGKFAANSRFIFHLTEHYYCLQFKGMRPELKQLNSELDMFDYLGREQSHFSRIIIDSNALPNHPLKAMLKACKPLAINVFFRRFDIGLETYVIDEKGSFTRSVHRHQKNHNPIKVMHRFLRSVVSREMHTNKEVSSNFGIFPIYFFELEQLQNLNFRCTAKSVVPDISQIAKIEVKAKAHVGNDAQIQYDYTCNNQVFSFSEFGQDMDIRTAKYILSQRSSDKVYPIYITDLDLSEVKEQLSSLGILQTSHYLKVKATLETRLNDAVTSLTSQN